MRQFITLVFVCAMIFSVGCQRMPPQDGSLKKAKANPGQLEPQNKAHQQAPPM